MALLDAAVLADVLAESDTVQNALQIYAQRLRSHLAVYQLLSRWLTPLFQSERDGLAGWRDRSFAAPGRMRLSRGQMLKILTGTKLDWY